MASSAPRIIVIGGGPAGTFAAIAARRQDAAATVTLITDEACEPYEKPPLSKAVLLGTARPADALIAGPGGVASHGVTLERRVECASIDRAGRAVVLRDGRRMEYDALVIATGSTPRDLPLLPPGMPHVHYLRTEADAETLKAALLPGSNLLVVGGGLIGLEVAASAAQLGVHTTVVEVAPRILSRVCDEDTAAVVHAAHRHHHVDIRTGARISTAMPGTDGRIRVGLDTGEELLADVVVVGTGARPNDRLGADAGLSTDDGIIVDEQCRTSDSAIFAAGDVVRFPGPHGPVRLENWRHAQDHGTVAGRNAAGAGDAYVTVPSFWSEQYDLYVQGIGWTPPGGPRVVRHVPGGGLLTFEVADGRLLHATAINAQRDMATVRRLIERHVPVDAAALADPAQPLAAMLKRT